MQLQQKIIISAGRAEKQMKEPSKILLECHIKIVKKKETCAVITLIFDHHQQDYEAHLLQNSKMVLTSKEKNFTLNPQAKIIPNYDSSSKLESITINMPDQSAKIVVKNESYSQKLYEKLRRQLSHKGFNDYFKPIKRLGRGSFAAVYLVHHKATGEKLAAKVFSREGQKIGYMGAESLQTEIHMLKTLNHPNVIRFWGIYETDNLIYLVTEYLSGGTLEDFMRNKSTLMGGFITKIISDTLKALKYLQENNIMHRDLKPQNIIMRQSDQEWVLADFGLAAYINQKYLYDKCGTMGFIAPQILAENQQERPYTSSCDLYSLGVVAYNLILGCLPFKVEIEGMFDRKYIWDAFSKSQCVGLDEEILALLKGLLEKDPIKRLTPSQALASGFFTNPKVIERWRDFNKTKVEESYNKVLKMKNTL